MNEVPVEYEVTHMLKKPVARLSSGVGDACLAEESVSTKVCSEVIDSDQEEDEGSE